MATKTASVIARVEPEVKSKAEAILARLGLSASVVINALYHQVIYTNGIPFSLTVPTKVPSLENMSDEEFDHMIETSFQHAMNGERMPAEEAIASIRATIK